MKQFETHRTEGLQQRFIRFVFNNIPPYRGTGAKVKFISKDWYEVHVKLSLSWRTKNIMGSVFGGSIYSSIDPIYMAQLMRILGKEYVVWDKAASIRFKKPIRKVAYTQFLLSDELINKIKQDVLLNGEVDIELPVSFKDKNEIEYALINKKIYIASKKFYTQKQSKR